MLKAEEGEVFLTNQTGETILGLCTGENGVKDIVEKLVAQFPDQAAEQVEQDVMAFLARARDKGVVTWDG